MEALSRQFPQHDFAILAVVLVLPLIGALVNGVFGKRLGKEAVRLMALSAVGLSFLVHRTRFGRYVFAMGGNPEAAALVGIPVRRVTLMLFALVGVLITVAAIVSIARLNAGTNSLGTGMELYVIAAAVDIVLAARD